VPSVAVMRKHHGQPCCRHQEHEFANHIVTEVENEVMVSLDRIMGPYIYQIQAYDLMENADLTCYVLILNIYFIVGSCLESQMRFDLDKFRIQLSQCSKFELMYFVLNNGN